MGKNRFEFDVERVLVDDEAVITEGVIRHSYPGCRLVADGGAGAGSSTMTPAIW